jgi:hypothetical protein
MALAVIGAGFGRTGTDSMREALTMLGLGPCHHMREVMANPDLLAFWRAAADGRTQDWEKALAGYRSTVDWPAAYFWRQLAAFYPGARVLLTVRDPASWYESAAKTIFPLIRSSRDLDSFGVKVIAGRIFRDRLEDRDFCIGVFERHNAEVRAAFGPDRLLVYAIGDGWEPLCRFFGKPVPEVAFPRSNTADDFRAIAEQMSRPKSA